MQCVGSCASPKLGMNEKEAVVVVCGEDVAYEQQPALANDGPTYRVTGRNFVMCHDDCRPNRA
jgi:hypothetical protein